MSSRKRKFESGHSKRVRKIKENALIESQKGAILNFMTKKKDNVNVEHVNDNVNDNDNEPFDNHNVEHVNEHLDVDNEPFDELVNEHLDVDNEPFDVDDEPLNDDEHVNVNEPLNINYPSTSTKTVLRGGEKPFKGRFFDRPLWHRSL
jgi:hypothetical protein